MHHAAAGRLVVDERARRGGIGHHARAEERRDRGQLAHAFGHVVHARRALEAIADGRAQPRGRGVPIDIELRDAGELAQLVQLGQRDVLAATAEQRPRSLERGDVLGIRVQRGRGERHRVELLARRLARIRHVARLRAAAAARHEVELEPRQPRRRAKHALPRRGRRVVSARRVRGEVDHALAAEHRHRRHLLRGGRGGDELGRLRLDRRIAGHAARRLRRDRARARPRRRDRDRGAARRASPAAGRRPDTRACRACARSAARDTRSSISAIRPSLPA